MSAEAIETQLGTRQAPTRSLQSLGLATELASRIGNLVGGQAVLHLDGWTRDELTGIPPVAFSRIDAALADIGIRWADNGRLEVVTP